MKQEIDLRPGMHAKRWDRVPALKRRRGLLAAMLLEAEKMRGREKDAAFAMISAVEEWLSRERAEA